MGMRVYSQMTCSVSFRQLPACGGWRVRSFSWSYRSFTQNPSLWNLNFTQDAQNYQHFWQPWNGHSWCVDFHSLVRQDCKRYFNYPKRYTFFAQLMFILIGAFGNAALRLADKLKKIKIWFDQYCIYNYEIFSRMQIIFLKY